MDRRCSALYSSVSGRPCGDRRGDRNRGDPGPVFIAGDKPVTEEQVRSKLQADGYLDVRIVREGQYFEATGAKDGKAASSGSMHEPDASRLTTTMTTTERVV